MWLNSITIRLGGGLLAFHHSHNILFPHHNQFVAVHLHFGSAVLAEEDLVADFDVERPNLAVLQDLALADGNDLAEDGFLGRRVRDHNAARGFTLFFFSFHDHTAMEGSNLHRTRLLMLDLRVLSRGPVSPPLSWLLMIAADFWESRGPPAYFWGVLSNWPGPPITDGLPVIIE